MPVTLKILERLLSAPTLLQEAVRLVAKKQTSGPEDLNLIPSITVKTFVFLITIGITIVNHKLITIGMLPISLNYT